MKNKRLLATIIGLGFLCLFSFSIFTITPCYAAPLSGAIFTTTPDGSIVNENVRYTSKLEVYLDGGPPPNAPAWAAGLPDGWYVFQVTDPSGWVQLSEDPAKCRIVEVSGGVIVRLVKPHELSPPLNDWYTVGNGKNGITYPCHIQNEPDGVAGPSGRHDTNNDTDHGADMGAIVVQLMPFLDTPNPGGVYKAWIIPLERYLANGGNLEQIPVQRGLVKKKGVTLGFKPDPGFGPPRDQSKTDNFKVKEVIPPAELRVRKFHDLNANGVWDVGEPEIGIDKLVDGGGWPISITDPLFVTNNYYTPVLVTAEPAGNYVVQEVVLSGWYQSAAYRDGVYLGITNPVTVTVTGAASEQHEVVFGNYMPAEICGKKFEDINGNGAHDTNEPGVLNVHITLSGTDGFGNSVFRETWTDNSGAFCFIDLNPGTYTVTETVPDGWVASTITSVEVTLISGDEMQLGYVFGNFRPAELCGKKFEDLDGDGAYDAGEPGVAGVHITLSGTDGKGNLVSLETWTDGSGVFCFMELNPGTYTVTETVPDGWVASTVTSVQVTLKSGDVVELGYVFGNFRSVDIYAHKFFDFNEDGDQDEYEQDLAGIRICLTQDGVPVTEDAFGNPIDSCQFTDEDGMVYWRNLRPGIYTISEDLAGSLIVGLYPTTDTTVTVEIISGQEPVTVEFGNVGPCNGLTPGYWKNWRNHYTPAQFALLLEGTIADVGDDAANIAAADAIFEHWDASDPSDLTILKAFVLANQLTINLTQNPGLPNPSNGSLFYACLLTGRENLGTLGDALSNALDIISRVEDANPYNDPSDAYILYIKDILDAFANQRTW